MREAKMGRMAVAGTLLLVTTLIGCKKSTTVDPTKIERYGSDELAASGVAYVPEPVAARTAADQEATAAALVPAGKPLTRLAEKGGFVLIEWADDGGEKRQGWLYTTTAKLSATPVQVERAPGDEAELDPRKIAPPRPAAPRPVAEPSPAPAATGAEPTTATAAQPGEVQKPAGLGQTPAPQPTAAPTQTTQPTAAPAPTIAPAPAPAPAPE